MLNDKIIIWTSLFLDILASLVFARTQDFNLISGMKRGSVFSFPNIDLFVNQSGTSQVDPWIISLDGGNYFAIFYQSTPTNDPNPKVYGKLYHANGTNYTDVFRINPNDVYPQSCVRAAELKALKAFVVTWEIYDIGTYSQQIYSKIYSYNGSILRDSLVAYDSFQNDQLFPSVAPVAGGNKFIVVWQLKINPMDISVIGKLFQLDGTSLGIEFTANTLNSNEITLPSVYPFFSNGSFIILWHHYDGSDQYSLKYRVYDEFGTNLTDETVFASYQSNIPSACLNFIVTYPDDYSGSYSDIIFSIYNSSFGKVVDNDRASFTTDKVLTNPFVAANDPGEYYAITWESFGEDGDQLGVYFRYYTPVNAGSGVFRINNLITGNQSKPKLCWLSSNNMVVTWQGENMGLDNIFFRILDFSCNSNFDCFDSICYDKVCLYVNLQANISANSIFPDQSITLTWNASTEVPYIFNFTWKCQISTGGNTFSDCPPAFRVFLNSMPGKNSTIIPGSYFTNFMVNSSCLFRFQLNTSMLTSQAYQYIVNVSDEFSFSVLPYDFYVSSLDYYITILENNHTPLSSYNLTVNPPLSFQIISNFSTVILFKNSHKFLPNELNVKLQVSRGSISSRIFLIPLNNAPCNGSLTIVPQSGDSLITEFQINAVGWIDQQLPLQYRFWYFFPSIMNISNAQKLSNFDLSPNLQTIFPGMLNTEILAVVSEVADSFLASNLTTYSAISRTKATFTDETISMRYALNVLNTWTNLTNSQKILRLSIISDELFHLELQTNPQNLSNPETNPGCPLCTGHGTCITGYCICIKGWTAYDCSINETDYLSAIVTKLQILSTVSSLLKDSKNKNDSDLTTVLDKTSSNPNYNSLDTLWKLQDILDYQLKIKNESTFLTKMQAKNIFNILDHIFTYISIYDCVAITNLTKRTFNSSADYIDSISRGLAHDLTVNSSAEVLVGDNYALNVQKSLVCDLINRVLTMNLKNTPNLKLNYDPTSSPNCSQEVIVQFLAIDSDFMSCNHSKPKNFSTIGLKLMNPRNFKPLDLNISINITFSSLEAVSCDTSKCQLSGLVCICPSLSIFNVKSQFELIFKNSQLQNLFNFSALSHYRFLNSEPFWIIISFFLLTIILMPILKRYEDRNYVDSYLKGSKKSKLKNFTLMYCAAQSFLSIFVTVEGLPKRMRCYLFYVKTVVMLTYTSIFGLTDDIKIDSIWSNLFNFSFHFNLYVFILPYFTVIPILSILTKINARLFGDDLISKKTKKFKKLTAISITSLVVIFCNLIIVIITAQMSIDLKNLWMIYFILLQFQDLFINPPLKIAITALEVKILNITWNPRWNKLKYLLQKNLDINLTKLMGQNKNFMPTSNHKKVKRVTKVKRIHLKNITPS